MQRIRMVIEQMEELADGIAELRQSKLSLQAQHIIEVLYEIAEDEAEEGPVQPQKPIRANYYDHGIDDPEKWEYADYVHDYDR